MKPSIDALVNFYETLTPASLDEIEVLYAPDARFKDPFNEVCGVPMIRRVFEHMFEQVGVPRFVVVNRIVDGDQAVLEWVFDLKIRGREISVRGATLFVLDTQGRVTLHRDYWDTGEELYAKLPVLGGAVRWLRRQMRASE